MPTTIKDIIVGKARDPMDPRIFHTVSLAAFLAWVGLGADGLSSSAYGPEEAFKALGSHAYLAVWLAILTALTVFIISLAYSKVIELFPAGGGGYLVATKLLGPKLGVVSGCALVVDYVLTISISIASGVDQLFSLLPLSWAPWKFRTEFLVGIILIVLNLRGIKESIRVLVPIFLLFIGMHVLLIVTTLITRLYQLDDIFVAAAQDAGSTSSELGWFALALIMMRAYSLGGGTYTGIEAVSNSVQVLREPRVANAKRTMLYMAVSLAFTAGGIILGYLLVGARPVPDRTMNAVYAESVFGHWTIGGLAVGPVLVALTLISAGALLFVAAQTGFLAGPRVLANMAVDSWVPRRFAQLSDRLVANNGIYLMGIAALATLWYTHGSVAKLVVMYSINVFLTFSLTLLGMVRHWTLHKGTPDWKRNLALHLLGLGLCLVILIVTVYEKFEEGGWLTVIVTTTFVTLAFLMKRHYARVRNAMRRIDETLLDIPVRPHAEADPQDSPGRARRRDARQRVHRNGSPHRALGPEPLSPSVQELPVPLDRRHRLRELQGRRRDRRAEAARRRPTSSSTWRSPGSSAFEPSTATTSERKRSKRWSPSARPCGRTTRGPSSFWDSSCSKTTASTTVSSTTKRRSRSRGGCSSAASRRSSCRSACSSRRRS